MGGIKDAEAVSNAGAAAWALGGSNRDVVANRAAIRMANLSAAETLKAELASLMPVKSRAQPQKPISAPPPPPAAPAEFSAVPVTATDVDMEVPGFGTGDPEVVLANAHADATSVNETETTAPADNEVAPVAGVKRPFEAVADTPGEEDSAGENDVEAEAESTSRALDYKVNADGTVEQPDTVRYVACSQCMRLHFETLSRLWEPGYRERYYRQKFDVEHTDQEFKKKYSVYLQLAVFCSYICLLDLQPTMWRVWLGYSRTTIKAYAFNLSRPICLLIVFDM